MSENFEKSSRMLAITEISLESNKQPKQYKLNGARKKFQIFFACRKMKYKLSLKNPEYLNIPEKIMGIRHF